MIDDATLNVIMVWIAMLIVGSAIYLMIEDIKDKQKK